MTAKRLARGVLALAIVAPALAGALPAGPAVASAHMTGTVTFKGYYNGTAALAAVNLRLLRGCEAMRVSTVMVRSVQLYLGNITLTVGGQAQAVRSAVLDLDVARWATTEAVKMGGGKQEATAQFNFNRSGLVQPAAVAQSGTVTTTKKGRAGSAQLVMATEQGFAPVAGETTDVSASWSGCGP